MTEYKEKPEEKTLETILIVFPVTGFYGFYMCECLVDHYLSVIVMRQVSFSFGSSSILLPTCLWNISHENLWEAEVHPLQTSNINNEKQTYYLFLWGVNTQKQCVLLKIRNNCKENCSQFQQEDNIHLQPGERMTCCDHWFPQKISRRRRGRRHEEEADRI